MRLGITAALALLGILGCQRDTPVPPEIWKPAYFLGIDSLTDRVNIPKLRDSKLPQGDIELRVWIGFGMARLQGLSINRNRGEWSAVYISETEDGLSGSIRETRPQTDWENFWMTLKKQGILTLPDQSELKSMVLVLDGESYVVEYFVDGDYRSYMYSNPDYQRGPEAKKIIEIIRTLRRELIHNIRREQAEPQI